MGHRHEQKILPVLPGLVVLVMLAIAASATAGSASWPEPAYVTLTGSVSLTGDKNTSEIKSGQFQFKVTSESDDLKLPERINDTATGGGLSLGSYTFAEAGSYRFEIQQVKGSAAGYTYDLDAVTADIRIKYNSRTNKMESTITYKKAGQTVSGISFTNTYTEEKAEAPVSEEKKSEPAAVAPVGVDEPELLADLEVTYQVSEEAVAPGGEAVFSMKFVNTGDTTLEGLYVRQYVPAYMLYLECEETGSYGAIDGYEHATWFIAELAPGESVEMWLTCRLYICLPDDVKIMSLGYYEVTGSTETVLTNDPQDPGIMLDEVEVGIE